MKVGYNQCKYIFICIINGNILMRQFKSFILSPRNLVCIDYSGSASHFRLVTFQVLSNHTCQVPTILGSRDAESENKSVVLTGREKKDELCSLPKSSSPYPKLVFSRLYTQMTYFKSQQKIIYHVISSSYSSNFVALNINTCNTKLNFKSTIRYTHIYTHSFFSSNLDYLLVCCFACIIS